MFSQQIGLLKTLFAQHSSVMLLVDPESGDILDANPAAARFYGYPQAELCRMNICQINVLTPEQIASERQRALNHASNVFVFPHRMASGEVRTVEVHSAPIQIGGQELLFSIIQDISQRVRAEQTLVELNDELEQRVLERTRELECSNQDLEGFCYAISHELRAPIARIEGFSNMLQESLDSGEVTTQRHSAARINFSIRQLSTVVDGLLLLHRLPLLDMLREQVDLSALAREIVQELRQDAGDRQVAVTIAPGLSAVGDPSLLAICLRNLLGNAFKFTMTSAQSEVSFDTTNQQGKTVFYVRDTGVGFDMTLADKLFQPFCRLHSEHEFAGQGIGLATVKRIIEKHGGQIWAESRLAAGTTFYFTLGTNG